MLPLSDSMHEVAGWFTISCSEQSACSIGGEEGGRRGGGEAPNPLLATNIFRKFTYTKSNFEGVAPNRYFP